MFEKRDLYRAVATLAYIIACADGVLQDEERNAFAKIVSDELDEQEQWSALSRFEILEEGLPSIEQAYKSALFEISQSKNIFTQEMRSKFIHVLERVADAYKGTDSHEDLILERFKKDTERLVK